MAIIRELDVKGPGDKILDMIRAKYPDYHPVMAIADLAHHTESEELEFKCHQAVAKYVAPELKSVEVRAEITRQRRVVVEMFDEATIKHKEIPVLNLDRPMDDDIGFVSAVDAMTDSSIVGVHDGEEDIDG